MDRSSDYSDTSPCIFFAGPSLFGQVKFAKRCATGFAPKHRFGTLKGSNSFSVTYCFTPSMSSTRARSSAFQAQLRVDAPGIAGLREVKSEVAKSKMGIRWKTQTISKEWFYWMDGWLAGWVGEWWMMGVDDGWMMGVDDGWMMGGWWVDDGWMMGGWWVDDGWMMGGWWDGWVDGWMGGRAGGWVGVMLCCVLFCFVMCCCVLFCYVMFCHVTQCYLL